MGVGSEQKHGANPPGRQAKPAADNCPRETERSEPATKSGAAMEASDHRCEGGEEGVKTASFRSEEYNSTRRAFLRSYPLQWGDEQGHGSAGEDDSLGEEMQKRRRRSKRNISKGCVSLGSRVMAVLHLGEDKFLLLRNLKSKVAFYLVSCNPFVYSKHSNNLLTTA